MFRRRRREDEAQPENLELTGEETDDLEEAAEQEADEEAGREAGPAAGGQDAAGGPWDVDDSAPEMERIDFGAVRVPISPGIEVQVNVEAVEEDEQGNPVGGRIVAVTVVHGESGLQIQAFAAPKKSGIWDEVRKETAEEIQEAGGQTQEQEEGPFGPELLAMVPVQVPEEVMDQVPQEVREQGFAWQPVRFIGVDGPRWFLRGVVTGAAISDDQQREVLEDTFRGIVVARGEAPMPPRELLPLALPADAQQALDEQAAQEEEEGGRPPLNPFERGPEITEVR